MLDVDLLAFPVLFSQTDAFFLGLGFFGFLGGLGPPLRGSVAGTGSLGSKPSSVLRISRC